MNKTFVRNIIAYLIGGLGILLTLCAVGPNTVSDWFAGGDRGAGFALRGGLVGIPLICTAVILFFLRTGPTEAAEKTEAPPPATGTEAEGEKSGE
jgi:hypothetical protein